MDNITLYNILVGSTKKSLNRAKSRGKLELYDLHLLDIFGELLNDYDSDLELNDKRTLQEAIRLLRHKNKYICNYKNNDGEGSTSGTTNTQPTVGNPTITVSAEEYEFNIENFYNTFSDADGDNYHYLKIDTLPAYGTLTYLGENVAAGDLIIISETSDDDFFYIWTDTDNTTDTLTFRISDDNSNNPLFTDMATMTFNITAAVNLAPSQVGVLTINLDNATTHTFTADNFTTETTPVYLDPEGDAAENLKITSLPADGSLTIDGESVNINDTVSFTNIALGQLVYTSDSSETDAYSDSFNFSISDAGSNGFTAGGVMTLDVAAYVNEAPEVGDYTATVDEGVTFTFTSSMFTTDTSPAYDDTEGDAAVAVRFPTLPSAGVIYLNSIAIIANQEISITDIDSGLLTYTQASDAGGTSLSFEFDVQDSYGNWSE